MGVGAGYLFAVGKKKAGRNQVASFSFVNSNMMCTINRNHVMSRPDSRTAKRRTCSLSGYHARSVPCSSCTAEEGLLARLRCAVLV